MFPQPHSSSKPQILRDTPDARGMRVCAPRSPPPRDRLRISHSRAPVHALSLLAAASAAAASNAAVIAASSALPLNPNAAKAASSVARISTDTSVPASDDEV